MSNPNPTPKPQIVLLPGAWHKPSCFALLIPKLEAAGYTVHTTQLPSVTSSSPPKDLSADIQATRDLVDKAIGAGNEVVVVPHSWAGIVAGSALVGYGKKEREAKGQKGGVVRCAYMCAFLIDEGVSLMEAAGGKPPAWWTPDAEGELSHLAPSAKDIFYNDLPSAQREHYFSQVSLTHSLHAKSSKSTGAAWKTIPTYYLICEDDLAIPVQAQEGMVAAAKNAGGEVWTERLKSSHSPFLSHVDETAGWIRRVAGEEVQGRGGDAWVPTL